MNNSDAQTYEAAITKLQDALWKVFEMRQAQKFYFQTRTKGALCEAKQLEREVDEFLKDIAERRK